MNRTAIVLLTACVFLLLPYPSSALPTAAPQGIMVRPQSTIQTKEDVNTLINLCEEFRISTIFLMVKQDTGPESGLVYYTSARIPRISNFDVLSYTLQKAHEKNIKVHAWLPLLYDKNASETGLGIGGDWADPLQSASYYSTLVREVEALEPDGILIDYLRFPDDFSSSGQMRIDFKQESGYDIESVDLFSEKERNTQLWSQWIAYRQQVLSQFFEAVKPEEVPAGVIVTPEDVQRSNSEPEFFSMVNFVAAQSDQEPSSLINRLTLSVEAETYVILPNHYVSEVRQLISESAYADLLIFDSDTWEESDFQRIDKAENPFTDVRMTRLSFINFLNNQYDMEKWKSYETNTIVLPAGHVFWTYFKYLPYKEKWSAYTQKYNRDYVEEMIFHSQNAELYSVLELDIQSEEYVTKYKDAASITYQWGVMRNRVCLTELNDDPYKTEFFEMARFLADNYEAEALLITNISYLEDCFCSDCLESYIAFMLEKGITVKDWPRQNGEINIYDDTVGEWKTAQITQFLKDLKEYLRGSNKELWVEVPVSADLDYASSEYGLYLFEVEKIVDRIVLTNIDITNPPHTESVAKSLPTVEKYILNFFIESEQLPARAYLFDSLKAAYANEIESVGVYPQSALTDNLWSAFYIAYSYKLALTDKGLMEIYTLGDYGSVISTYFALAEEKKEEEGQIRERARQNIKEAERSHSRVLSTLEEARGVDLNVTAFEMDIQDQLDSLSEAEQLFVEGNYQAAEEKAKVIVVEFSTLNGKINKLVREERVKRISSGVLILVVFLLIMMYVRFKMRK